MSRKKKKEMSHDDFFSSDLGQQYIRCLPMQTWATLGQQLSQNDPYFPLVLPNLLVKEIWHKSEILQVKIGKGKVT